MLTEWVSYILKRNLFKEVKKNLNSVDGFVTAGINAGLRKVKPDMALIYSEEECLAIGAFTKNIVKAAPVLYSMKNLKNPIRAVIINSANANACTGEKGLEDVYFTANYVAQNLNISSKNVLVFSTGVIGEYLDMKKIRNGVERLSSIIKEGGNNLASKAILTTDTREKEVTVEFKIFNKIVKISGIAKGSGMIAPDMATMLAFLVSDIVIDKKLLKKLFFKAVENSFNLITVDGDMSTNDSVLFLTNQKSGIKRITEKDKREVEIFYNALLYVLKRLSEMIVRDGEGATKLIKIRVEGAKSEKDAKKIAFKIANSLLVKTAVYGADANWGRILASAGAAGVKFNPENVIIKFGKFVLYNGEPVRFSEAKVRKYLEGKDINIFLNLKMGKYSAEVLTSDLTEDYIKINSKYRT